MTRPLDMFAVALCTTWVAMLTMALVLTFLPRAGRLGRGIAERIAEVPLLDVVMAALTWLPWVVAGTVGGWAATAGTVTGQVLALYTWATAHRLLHGRNPDDAAIERFINRRYGRWRNHAALIVTLVGLPVLLLIRLAEVVAYPWLIWLLRFPRYRHGDWINVSRHKFDGLIGHDLVWCLYCDWMTGVYSLGAEMLRNVESFWCPIRFHNGKKCENCRLDFPDLENGWVPANASVREVERVMEQHYPAGQDPAWFGHPVRLTVKGALAESTEHPEHVPPSGSPRAGVKE